MFNNPITAIPNYFIDRVVRSAATSVAEYTVNRVNEILYTDIYADPSLMERRQLLCVSFNQDASSLSVGHEEGYTLYSLRSIDNLEKVHDGKVPQKTCVIERLFSSSLITLVSLQAARKLQVYHFQKENEICSHNYTGAILSVRLNRKRVIVCLEESIHVHNIRDMRLLHTIRDTPPNPLGLFDLSPGDESCYLAYPGSATTGHVHVFDAEALSAVCTIAAHDAPLAALKFNSDGTKLATASNKGTVIRVFEVPSGQRIAEFTRGMKRCVTIHSLAFSFDSKFLCSSSNTETVHVFCLTKNEEQQQVKQDPQDQSLSGWVSYFSQQASAYLPTQMNDLMLREKSFAYAHLPMMGTKNTVAMPRIGNRDYLVVASSDGYLFCYTIEPEGGECTLMRQYRIGPLTQEEIQQQQQNSAGQVIIASSGASPSEEEKKLYPNLSQEQQEASAPQLKATTLPVMVPQAAGSARQISTSPPSLTSAALSASPGAAIQPKITKMATPVKATSTVKAAPPAANPPPPVRASPRRDSDSDGSEGDLAPLGDLNDLDEFPPLSHATS